MNGYTLKITTTTNGTDTFENVNQIIINGGQVCVGMTNAALVIDEKEVIKIVLIPKEIRN
jgi:predicted aspartyl protease